MPGRLATIALTEPFLAVLARGLLRRAGGDPMALSRATVLLPTRRACLALRDAFLRESEGRPLLLPTIAAFDDVDEEELLLVGALGRDGGAAGLPPAIDPLRRQVLLVEAIRRMDSRTGADRSVEQCVTLARELARLLDRIQTEQLDFAGLADLVPEDYADHWQVTLEFLRILTEYWPAILEEEGAMDPAARRDAILGALADHWRAAPPPGPVIAAGSTGSVPATADLMAAILTLPKGEVILPGLDRSLDESDRAAVTEDPAHPQHGMLVLLRRLGVDPTLVEDWDATASVGPAAPPRRARLITEAMRPAARSDGWRALREIADQDLAAGLAGLHRIDCPGPQEEAGVIALLMRRALEPDREGRVCALVTPDRDLARRVATDLTRWRVPVDSSAGTPLALTVPAVFLNLVAELIAARVAPVQLLSALKHPLAAGGEAPEAVAGFRQRVRALERAVLRGPRPAPGFAGLLGGLRGMDRADIGLIGWVEALADAAAPFEAAMESRAVAPAVLLEAHVACAEALCGQAERLWAGEAGEAVAVFISELRAAARSLAPIAGRDWPGVLREMMADRIHRPRRPGHPRLFIWGPLEARLQAVDTVILGGLNEGTWPADVTEDPWMSRRMRHTFGLPPPERQIGLAAHDIAEALSKPEVYLTRARRVEGSETVPSRWLQRLDAVLDAAGLAPPTDEARDLLHWQVGLDRPSGQPRPVAPPAPTPPVAARPRRLSVTQIETWMRDPYAVYARHVLRLKRLDPLDADPGAADRGMIVHEVLDRVARGWPDGPPPPGPEGVLDPALEEILSIGQAVFADYLDRPGIRAFWWPRFRRVAGWFLQRERIRQGDVAARFSERVGELTLDAPAGRFVVHARADRVDRLTDGSLALIDFKTGLPPSLAEVRAGWACQLPLEAAIARAGGFEGVPGAPVSALEYWRLSGGETPGKVHAITPDKEETLGDLTARVVDGVAALVAAFDDPARAYHSVPLPHRAPRFSDYDHLARVQEWSVRASGEEA